MALAVPLSRFTPRVGGGSAFFVRQHYTLMKTRKIALSVFVIGLLVTLYLCWAWYRTTRSVLISEGAMWPQPWPYPDKWLYGWEQRLELANLPPPGVEARQWHLLHTRLSYWIGLSAAISIGSYVWVILLRKRDHAA